MPSLEETKTRNLVLYLMNYRKIRDLNLKERLIQLILFIVQYYEKIVGLG